MTEPYPSIVNDLNIAAKRLCGTVKQYLVFTVEFGLGLICELDFSMPRFQQVPDGPSASEDVMS